MRNPLLLAIAIASLLGAAGCDLTANPRAAQEAVLACTASGQSGAVWFDSVSVRAISPAARTAEPARPEVAPKASIEVKADVILRQIPRTLYGTNVEWIGNANGLWQEGPRRVHPELLRLSRELGVTVVRYPGGLFSDFYHWRNGVGPFERRPEAQHEPGTRDKSRPNFGTDEALQFAEQLGAELFITVNAGSGTAQEAADWVRYVNRDSLRVRHWEVGNELYIKDGSAMSRRTTVDPAVYASRFLQFARAMRAADPRIRIGAIGGENRERYQVVGYPNWNRTVLERAGKEIDFLAVHNAYAPGVFSDPDPDLHKVYRAMLAAPVLVARNLDQIARQIAQYAPDRAAEIGIAVTEWGPFFQADPSGRYVDHNKTLGSALYAASTLKALIESPRVEIANFHTLHDYGIMGWIGSRNNKFPPNPDWAPTARYYALQLFTRHFGDQLVESATVGPRYDSEAIGLVGAVRNVPYLDVVASLSADGRRLYILAINKYFDNPIEAEITLRGFAADSRATAWTLNGTGIDAHTGTMPLAPSGLRWGRQVEDSRNPRFSKGGPREITLASSPVNDAGARFTYRFPSHSVTSLELTRAR